MHFSSAGLCDEADHSGIHPLARKIRHAGLKRLILLLYQDTSRDKEETKETRFKHYFFKNPSKRFNLKVFKNKYEAKFT